MEKEQFIIFGEEFENPYPNFHAARVKQPGLFVRIVVLQTLPNGIMIYGGPLKSDPGGSGVAQAYRFSKEKFTVVQAKKWLKDHNIEYILFEPAKAEFMNKNRTVEILLYGDVGDENKIDGDMIARQINETNEIGDADLIVERINSRGGMVFNGLSVVAANLNSKIEIHTYNDGIAASMAGIILLTGNKVFAADYSQLMLHEPSLLSETIETTQDEKVKRGLTAIRDSLSKIIQNRTGKDKDEVDKILKDETWYDARTAKRQGFVDEVISFAKKPKIKSEMSVDELLMEVTAFYNNDTKILYDNIFSNLNNDDMEAIKNLKMFNAFLNINENAGEVDMFKEVQKIVAANDKLTKEVSDKATEIEKLEESKGVLKDELKGYKAQAEESRKEKIELLLTGAGEAGKITEDAKEDYRNLAELDDKGFEYVKKAIEKIKPYQSVSKHIEPDKKKTEERKDYTWADYHKKGLLEEIKAGDIDLYNELFEAKFGKKPEA